MIEAPSRSGEGCARTVPGGEWRTTSRQHRVCGRPSVILTEPFASAPPHCTLAQSRERAAVPATPEVKLLWFSRVKVAPHSGQRAAASPPEPRRS